MKRFNYTLSFLLGAFATPLFAQIPNAGFEDWDSLTLINNVRIYDPAEWSTSNTELFSFNNTQTVETTTDAHSGNYAVKLISAVDDEQQQGTYLSSGLNVGEGPTDPSTSKFPLQGRINGFEGYYKFNPNGADTFMVYLALYRNGQYLGQAFMRNGTPVATYTKFSWPVNFPSTIDAPDSAKFIITPSIFDESEGSELYLDDLKITYGFATGVVEEHPKVNISIAPNPTVGKITLLGYDPRHPFGYHVMSVNGKLIQSGTLTKDTLDVESLDNGLYLLTLINEEGQVSTHKFVKQ
jgi:hypothetical protein